MNQWLWGYICVYKCEIIKKKNKKKKKKRIKISHKLKTTERRLYTQT